MSNAIAVNHLYSKRAEERRKQFNRLIDSCNMVLMNNITEVDDSIWDNFETDYNFMGSECDVHQISKNGEDDGLTWFHCEEHDKDTLDEYGCEDYEDMTEVYQWFAVGSSDADFLKRHGQYITYSDMLDTHFLAITHFGTSWDYTSMVDDFEDCYINLEDFSDEKED